MLKLPRALEEVGTFSFGPDLEVNGHGASFTQEEVNMNLLKYPNLNSEYFPNPNDEMYRGTKIDQYLRILAIKNEDDNTNSDVSSEKYQVYQGRLEKLVQYSNGHTLDIGCDDLNNLKEFLPFGTKLCGLDPNKKGERLPNKIIGLAEFLPFQDRVFDTVMLNTSADHIFDYKLAILEAKRVLKPGGRILFSTLIWLSNIELYRDSVHFHHFSPGEIESLFEGLELEYLRTYKYGQDLHRYGAFFSMKTSH